MITTDKGHFWLTFDNNYTISVFNGFGSYSENHYNRNIILYPINSEQEKQYIEQRVESKDCEIAIINPNGDLVTRDYIDCGDSVKGYVSINELVDIINLVKNIDNDNEEYIKI